MTYNRRRILLSALVATPLPWAGMARPATSAQPAAPPSAGGVSSAPGDPVVLLDAHAVPSSGSPKAMSGLAYAPASPGPVLRLKKGLATRLRLANRMDEPTIVDWHGLRLPNAFATVPGLVGAAIAPGATAESVLTPMDIGTAWFHAGLLAGVGDQTARGLAGVVVVEEPDAPDVDADKVLFLAGPAHGEEGSGAVLVNGKAVPELDTYPPGARLRLRIVNGSTSEAFALSFTGGAVMVIAIDGQPSELFRPLNDSFPIGPGARFDVLVDLPRTPDAEFKLLRGIQAGAAQPAGPVLYAAKMAGTAVAARPPMRPLTPNPALPQAIPLEHATRVNMTVGAEPPGQQHPQRWSVNGTIATTLARTPLFSVKRNSAVTLGFINASTQLTAFRLHGHVMRLLHAMDDGWEPYWRDSVIVPPGATHHAAFLADNPGKWLIESPFFDQAAGGLRSWFEVT